jgi:hypothetical protein
MTITATMKMTGIYAASVQPVIRRVLPDKLVRLSKRGLTTYPRK